MKRRRGMSIIGILLVTIVLVGIIYQVVQNSRSPSVVVSTTTDIPPIYALAPTPAGDLRNPEAVTKATEFIETLQPDGTYVLSRKGSQIVNPMNVAHAAIAFVSVDQLKRAESAMTWLYGQITQPDSPDAVVDGVDYSGSWHDSMLPDGTPVAGAPRGRGEAVGMALIATYSIYAQQPDYVTTRVGDNQVIDYVRLAADYLTRPTMQTPAGRFYHSPTYQVSFNEECARMTLGLQLAGKMLKAQENLPAAERATAGATLGLKALDSGAGMNQGMAYDYYARSIWSLATPAQAKQEIAWLKSTGLLESQGVRNWDWQLDTATKPLPYLHWWAQAQTIAPSQTFDFAIASINAGDVGEALHLEKVWLPLQRADGGFNDAFVFGPFGSRIGFGEPTSYSAARFVLMEHLLTNVVGR